MSLFKGEPTKVDTIIAAVNRRIRGSARGAYNRAEAVATLKKIDKANNIM